MAIGKGNNSSNVATSGTTCLAPSGTGTINVSTGSVVIINCAVLGTGNTITFTKSAGTCVLGAFATNLTKVNGNANQFTCAVRVTTGGTLRILATSSGTITNCCLEIQEYTAGADWDRIVAVNGSGASGTTITGTITTRFDNSWVVLCATSVSATALTAGTGMAAGPIIASSNISGTANDLTTGIGSNEAALSQGAKSITFNQASNATYSYVYFELVSAFLVTPPVKSLTTTKFAPQANLAVIPPVKALTTSRFAPQANLAVIPPVKALTTTKFAPAISITTIGDVIIDSANIVNEGLNATSGTRSLNVTVAEAGEVLAICVGINSFGASPFVNNVTVDGNAATPVYDNAGGSVFVGMWKYINQSVGTVSVSINLTGNSYGGWGVVPVKNADTSAPLRDQGGGVYYVSNSGSSTAPSSTITSLSKDKCIDIVKTYNQVPSIAGVTQKEAFNAGTSTDRGAASYSYGAASVVMSWSPGETNWAQIAVSFKPPSAVTVTPPVKSVVLTKYVPQVNLGIIPPLKALATTRYSPAINVGVSVSPGVTNLVTNRFAPLVIMPVLVTVPLKALTLSAKVLALGAAYVVPVKTVSITRLVPQLQYTVIVPKTSLIVTRLVPQLQTTVTVPKKSLTTTAFTPTVSSPRLVTVPKTAITITRFVPQLQTKVTVPVKTFTTTKFAPLVIQPKLVTPGRAAEVLTGFPPSIQMGGPQTVIPGLALLVLTSFAPNILATSPPVPPVTPTIVIPGIGTVARKKKGEDEVALALAVNKKKDVGIALTLLLAGVE